MCVIKSVINLLQGNGLLYKCLIMEKRFKIGLKDDNHFVGTCLKQILQISYYRTERKYTIRFTSSVCLRGFFFSTNHKQNSEIHLYNYITLKRGCNKMMNDNNGIGILF